MPALRSRIAATLLAGALAACAVEEPPKNSGATLDEAWLEEWWSENIPHMTTIVIDMEESELAWWEIHELTEEMMDALLQKRFWLQTRLFGFWSRQYSWRFLLAGDCDRAKAHLDHILSRPKSAGRIKVIISEGTIECHPGSYFQEPDVIDLGKVRNPPREKEQP